MRRIGKSMDTESRLVVVRGWGEEWRVADEWVWLSFWGDENVRQLGIGDGSTALNILKPRELDPFQVMA